MKAPAAVELANGLVGAGVLPPPQSSARAFPSPLSPLIPLQDGERCGHLVTEFDGIVYDYSRQQVTVETMQKLLALAGE